MHHNTGHGLWMDYNVRSVRFEDNLIEDNTGTGSSTRSPGTGSSGTTWSGTTPRCTPASRAIWGAQIHVINSRNVEIDDNTVRSTNGSNGICAVDIDRTATAPASTKVADLFVHDNVVRCAARP